MDMDMDRWFEQAPATVRRVTDVKVRDMSAGRQTAASSEKHPRFPRASKVAIANISEYSDAVGRLAQGVGRCWR